MPVTIDSLRLWNTSESAAEATGKTNPQSAPIMDSDETILVGLEAVERVSLTGRATGNIISNQAGYDSDPDTALREWTLQFETLCNPEQGTGYTLVDDERNRSINVVVDETSWTRRAGETSEVEWSLKGYRGEGVFDDVTRSPDSPTTVSTEKVSYSGTDYVLGAIRDKTVTRRMELVPTPLALQGTAETLLTPNSGVTRTVTFSGVKYGTWAEMRTFDSGMRGLLGTNTEVTYHAVFPGDTYTGMVDAYDSYFREGQVAAMDYYLKVIEGTTSF